MSDYSSQAKIVLDMMVTMFSEYCAEPFTWVAPLILHDFTSLLIHAPLLSLFSVSTDRRSLWFFSPPLWLHPTLHVLSSVGWRGQRLCVQMAVPACTRYCTHFSSHLFICCVHCSHLVSLVFFFHSSSDLIHEACLFIRCTCNRTLQIGGIRIRIRIFTLFVLSLQQFAADNYFPWVQLYFIFIVMHRSLLTEWRRCLATLLTAKSASSEWSENV